MNDDIVRQATTEFDRSWMRYTVTGTKAEVVKALIALRLAGERPTLAAAATLAGVPAGTVRAHKTRDHAFATAVEAAQGRSKRTPEPVDHAVHQKQQDADALRAEVDRWREAVRYEWGRDRQGRYADPRRAERALERAERELRAFETYP